MRRAYLQRLLSTDFGIFVKDILCAFVSFHQYCFDHITDDNSICNSRCIRGFFLFTAMQSDSSKSFVHCSSVMINNTEQIQSNKKKAQQPLFFFFVVFSVKKCIKNQTRTQRRCNLLIEMLYAHDYFVFFKRICTQSL